MHTNKYKLYQSAYMLGFVLTRYVIMSTGNAHRENSKLIEEALFEMNLASDTLGIKDYLVELLSKNNLTEISFLPENIRKVLETKFDSDVVAHYELGLLIENNFLKIAIDVASGNGNFDSFSSHFQREVNIDNFFDPFSSTWEKIPDRPGRLINDFSTIWDDLRKRNSADMEPDHGLQKRIVEFAKSVHEFMKYKDKRMNLTPDPKKVFVVHGRDSRLRDDFFSFLRALGLQPIEWSEALKLTAKATPYIGEALESAFKNAQAVIVLLSPDDEVRLSPELWKNNEVDNEKEFKLQARPNVLFEAGMAFGTHPNRTLLIEVGQVKAFSDVAGRHVIRLSNSAEKRNEVAERLRTSGCDVKTTGSDWLKTGNFDLNRRNKASASQSVGKLSKEAEKVLMFLTEYNEVTASQIANGISLNLNRTKYWLDTLNVAGMIHASFSMMRNTTTYSIAAGGRKYLFNNNMI